MVWRCWFARLPFGAVIELVRRMLAEALEVGLPCPDMMIGSMATLSLSGRFQERAFFTRIALEQTRLFEGFGVEVPLVRVGGGLRCFRISCHLHNHPDECRYLADAIRQL